MADAAVVQRPDLAALQAETERAYIHWAELRGRFVTLRIRDTRVAAARVANELQRVLLDDNATYDDRRRAMDAMHDEMHRVMDADAEGRS